MILKGEFMSEKITGIILGLLIILVAPALVRGNTNRALFAEPVVLEKAEIPIAPAVRSYLNLKGEPTAKCWVFFNDKGLFNKSDFALAAQKISIPAHAKKRREKSGIQSVVFADLPVLKTYIDNVISHGGSLRRVSRWLNAASFEIPHERLDEIAQLSFVNRIRPVAGFKKEKEIIVDDEFVEPQFAPTDTDFLDYGASWTQMYMISAYLLHDMGFNAQGVIVAMFDTGFRTSHSVFDQIRNDGRLLSTYDFIFDDDSVQNQEEDWTSAQSHGTSTWSVLGGWAPGYLIGPAYGASFLLAKTEDIRSETAVEEDNWVAALEWADSLEADVISSSLSYSDWYTYSDYDGLTATVTIAANTCAGLGIVLSNSIGNSGPDAGTLGAPADAFDILSIGAVNNGWSVTSFSSRGPTADGRIKPEVCAMGQSDQCADAGSDYAYGFKNGTSFSAPLVGGAAAVLISANPMLSALQIRKALMETATNAASPNNTYGWGIIDMYAAYNWGANFSADSTIAFDSLTVNFSDSSTVSVSSWKWNFGDGDSSEVQNPTHLYDTPGNYDVSLTIESPDEGTLARVKEGYIMILADTIKLEPAAAAVGDTAIMSVYMANSQELQNIIIPIAYSSPLNLELVEVTRGNRTVGFELLQEVYRDDFSDFLAFELTADTGGGTLPLESGNGEIARLHFVIGSGAMGQTAIIDTFPVPYGGFHLEVTTSNNDTYVTKFTTGTITVATSLRGDATNDGLVNIFDITHVISFLYRGGPPPISLCAGDANSDGVINIFDATFLITFLYKGGPAPDGDC